MIYFIFLKFYLWNSFEFQMMNTNIFL
ncbi:hypothetical protein, partial [Plasmodium yoelii yoelii]